ncbi:Thiol:disulfide interchange protein DsbD [uncultured archaeon]|nr:Thiol:disulfide interchange protein DsbD [uncultured archaeon]
MSGTIMEQQKAAVNAAWSPFFANALIFALAIVAISSCIIPALAEEGAIAPNFSAMGVDGKNVSLEELRGAPVVLHITNIEIPLCVECEKSLKGQVKELMRLKAMDPAAQIVTLNLRKNPYSLDGKSLAEKWWKVNITWPWTEDIEPYRIASKYLDYWNVRGGSSNPTILLLNKDGIIAGVYHVYRVGEGEIDGVQSAETLEKKLQDLRDSRWKGLEGEVSTQDVSLLGMFLLGILTSLAPCSIALLIAVFSYVLTIRRKDEYLRKSTSTSKEGFMMGIAFTIGMAAVFFVLGLFISQVGLFVRDSSLFDLIAGGIMILLGISNFKPLGEILEPVISRIRPTRGQKEVQIRGKSLMQKAVEASIGIFKHSAFVGAFALGVFFALGWAPCALSMVLPVLIWLASQNITPLAGGLMLFVFGVGHGVPIIPIATFSRAVGGRIGEKYVFLGWWTTRFFGLLVIAVGAVYAARYAGFLLW